VNDTIYEETAEPQSAESIPLDEQSEQALALDLVSEHRHAMRFVGDLKEWFVYAGTCWIPDHRRRIYSWALEVCRRAAAVWLEKPKTKKFARILTSAKTRAAVVSVVSDDQRISLMSEEFDHQPLLLGGPEMTLDCATGEARPPAWAGLYNQTDGHRRRASMHARALLATLPRNHFPATRP
jgi:hypothetical protein